MPYPLLHKSVVALLPSKQVCIALVSATESARHFLTSATYAPGSSI
jgi:hypothetical protein